jgi:hypothetical protein
MNDQENKERHLSASDVDNAENIIALLRVQLAELQEMLARCEESSLALMYARKASEVRQVIQEILRRRG